MYQLIRAGAWRPPSESGVNLLVEALWSLETPHRYRIYVSVKAPVDISPKSLPLSGECNLTLPVSCKFIEASVAFQRTLGHFEL